jgi:hypothetical protein
MNAVQTTWAQVRTLTRVMPPVLDALKELVPDAERKMPKHFWGDYRQAMKAPTDTGGLSFRGFMLLQAIAGIMENLEAQTELPDHVIEAVSLLTEWGLMETSAWPLVSRTT